MIRILLLYLAAIAAPAAAAAQQAAPAQGAVEQGAVEQRVVAETEILGLVADALLAREPGVTRHEITLGAVPALSAPVGAGAPALMSMDYQQRTGTFSAMVAAHPGAAPARVTGRAEAMIEAPALARAVQSGERIAAGDIVMVEVRADRLPSGAIIDPADIEGQEAKRTLRPGTPLRRYDVKIPSVIEKNEIITVLYARPGLTLAARGRALDDAPQGEALRVLNLQSNRVIEAVAEAPGRARVEPPRMYAAAEGGTVR